MVHSKTEPHFTALFCSVEQNCLCSFCSAAVIIFYRIILNIKCVNLPRYIFGDKAGDVKDASLKASPSLRGVVIDKKLFSRVIKSRSEKNADKAILPKLNDEFEEKAAKLKDILIEKLLVLTNGKVSQGVKDYLGTEVIAKGAKFTKRDLESLDYTIIQLSKWTADAHKNDMIRDLVMNYLKKYKELDAELCTFDCGGTSNVNTTVSSPSVLPIARTRRIRSICPRWRPSNFPRVTTLSPLLSKSSVFVRYLMFSPEIT